MTNEEAKAAEAALEALDTLAADRNERIFGFVLPTGIEWRRRSRADKRSPVERIAPEDVPGMFETAGADAAAEAAITAAAREKSIAWDTPSLTVFETTPERAAEIADIQNRRRWEPDRFTIDDLYDGDNERIAEDAGRTIFRLSREAKAKLVEHAQRAWCPVALRRGPSIEESRPHGCGVLATDGSTWAVITAAHALGTPANQSADLDDEPIWAAVSGTPKPKERGGPDEKQKVETTLIRTLEHVFLDPRTMRGRLDIGIARVDAARAEEACQKYGREPLDLRKAREWTIEDPVLGVKYVVGMPMDRQREGIGAGCMEATGPREGVKIYRPGGHFHYLSLGANGPEEHEATGNGNRSWRGFSGGPVWAYNLEGEERRIAGSGTEALSKTDWSPPKLAGIMFFQAENACETNNQKDSGWRDEIYALHINGAALELIQTMFAHDGDDNNTLQPVGATLAPDRLRAANEEWAAVLTAQRNKR